MFSIPSFDGDLTGVLQDLFVSTDDHYKEYVDIISSDPYWGEPTTLIDFNKNGNEDNCATKNVENSSYIIHLKKQKLYITDFSLKSRTSLDQNYPKSIAFESSNNGESWTELFSIKEMNYLNGLSKKKTFHLNKNGVFKYFRVKQFGNNTGGNHCFVLNKIELFGKLCSLDDNCNNPLVQKNICIQRNRFNFLSFIVILLT